MTLPTLVACLLAVLFFMSGCFQVAIYVGTTQPTPFTAYFPGLLTAAWPLAVAAVVFVLVDMRIHMSEMKKAEPEIPEVPMPPRRTIPSPTYFAAAPYSENEDKEASTSSPDTGTADKRSDLNFFKM